MHRLWRKRGRRIRPNDKDLVFRTVFFLLFAVFAVAFVLLNIRTDWRSPSVAYLLFSAAMGVKVCTVTAWLLYRRFPDKLNEMRHRQKLARMVLENQWYEQSDTKQSEGFLRTCLQVQNRRLPVFRECITAWKTGFCISRWRSHSESFKNRCCAWKTSWKAVCIESLSAGNCWTDLWSTRCCMI